jgi:hypothetical protein
VPEPGTTWPGYSPPPETRGSATGPRALTYAREALASRRQPAWLDTLAAAHAECGDFGRAIAAEEEALRLSDPPNERFRRRLGGYRLGLSLVDQRAVHGPA